MKSYAAVSLKEFHTFAMEVRAEAVHELTTVASAQVLYMLDASPSLVLGGGSNVLFTQDFAGTILLNRIMGIEAEAHSATEVKVKVGAGVPWHQLIDYCLANDFGGLENLTLIPGCTGASPMQNIGAYGVEIKDVFEALEAVERSTGNLRRFGLADCAFGYRESVFKRALKDQFIITSVTFRLRRPGFHQLHLDYGVIRQELESRNIASPTIQEVSAVVAHIRRSKLPDPKEVGNAGSFFKNPVVSATHYAQLQSGYPQIPGFVLPDGQVKIPAAWLIETAGFKGQRRGDAGCHPRQALVLVNYGYATGADILALANDIIETVQTGFGVTLEKEVNIIGPQRG